MNNAYKIYTLQRNGAVELYYAPQNKPLEKIVKDMRVFRNDGWIVNCVLETDEESYYQVKFKDLYCKHSLYLELYHKGAEFETEDGDYIVATELVYNTATKLVVMARKIMSKNFDVEIPELVHMYIMNFDREDPDRFREVVLS